MSCPSATMSRNTLPAPLSAAQMVLALPVAISATMIDHGFPSRAGANMSNAEDVGTRMKASRRPSGDHAGLPSRSTLGDIQETLLAAGSYTPTKAWSPRLLTNARREPSGDQEKLPAPFLTLNSCTGSLLPSTGAVNA